MVILIFYHDEIESEETKLKCIVVLILCRFLAFDRSVIK